MGTWDHGLLDNDTAFDGLGELSETIVEDIVGLGESKPGASTTAKLGAAVGVLLQLKSYPFGLDTESGPRIVRAVAAHAGTIAKLPLAAKKVLGAVAEGKGAELAERPGKVAKSIGKLLHAGSGSAPFGKREASLFEGPAAEAYVQSVAKRCIESIGEDFEDEDTVTDLCREGINVGMLAALFVLEPCKVSVAKLEAFRKKARKGLAFLEKEPDDEIDFHRKYYANLDKLLAALTVRFS